MQWAAYAAVGLVLGLLLASPFATTRLPCIGHRHKPQLAHLRHKLASMLSWLGYGAGSFNKSREKPLSPLEKLRGFHGLAKARADMERAQERAGFRGQL
jgi:hypothetical protein